MTTVKAISIGAAVVAFSGSTVSAGLFVQIHKSLCFLQMHLIFINLFLTKTATTEN